MQHESGTTGPEPGTTGAAPQRPARVQALLGRTRAVLAARRTRWLAGGVALLVLGVLTVGAGLGWAGRSFVDPPVPDAVAIDPVALPPTGADVQLPDVRGLALADAEQAFADAGLDPAVVTTVEVPSAQPGGTVVGQDPVGGTRGASAVTLSVAVSGTVPDLAGTDRATAVQTLLELGVGTRVVEVYDPAATVGVVLASDPAPGSALPREVALTVAGPPGSLFLTDLPTQSGCGTGSAAVDGQTYADSLVCSAGSSPRTVVYLIDRVTTQLTGTLGVLDSSDLGYAGRITLRGDGVDLFSADLGYGTAVPFTVSTAGVLQLQVEFVRSPDVGNGVDGQLVAGDVRVVGSPADIDGLADE